MRQYFNPRSPHGERRRYRHRGAWYLRISIHAPAWGATAAYGLASSTSAFQSTLPHGERRRIGIRRIGRRSISIHAPRMGSDERPAWCIHRACYFNPRSRMGSDNSHHPRRCLPSNFNPRSRMGSDWTPSNTKHLNKSFQSTLPHGERLCSRFARKPPTAISIHAPAWGATRLVEQPAFAKNISIHAPAWGATL